jgi:hypothetical protein
VLSSGNLVEIHSRGSLEYPPRLIIPPTSSSNYSRYRTRLSEVLQACRARASPRIRTEIACQFSRSIWSVHKTHVSGLSRLWGKLVRASKFYLQSSCPRPYGVNNPIGVCTSFSMAPKLWPTTQHQLLFVEVYENVLLFILLFHLQGSQFSLSLGQNEGQNLVRFRVHR